jgi:mono/diheme cytochrome c family protein
VRINTLRRGRPTHAPELLAIGVVALVAVFVQGYLGGRMTYDKGVGVYAGGELAQTGAAAKRLDVALAKGASPAAAGRDAFQEQNLGCASCHGDKAQGLRGPSLAGGRDIDDFRRVHGKGLFPATMVSDRDFAAIDAWLRTLQGHGDQ